MKGLARWYKNWRHGRGFGVHSPLAYRLVSEVLRPRGDACYYGEAWARALFAGDSRSRVAATVLRLLADRNPRSVALISGAENAPSWRRLIAGTVPRAQIADTVCTDSEFIIVDSTEGLSVQDLMVPADTKSLPGGKGVYTVFTNLRDKSMRRIFEERFVRSGFRGLIIDSERDTAVCVARHGLPRQYISARF